MKKGGEKMFNKIKSAFGGNSKIAISVLSVILALALMGGLTLNRATAQKNLEGENNPLRALAAIDSRLVDVPRACTADQVTIIPDSVAGEGGTCLDAKADCRAKLARNVANKANKECKLYSKVDDENVQCRAFRGNFDPTTNIQYDPEGCKKREGQEFFDVRCTNQAPIKYTCN